TLRASPIAHKVSRVRCTVASEILGYSLRTLANTVSARGWSPELTSTRITATRCGVIASPRRRQRAVNSASRAAAYSARHLSLISVGRCISDDNKYHLLITRVKQVAPELLLRELKRCDPEHAGTGKSITLWPCLAA